MSDSHTELQAMAPWYVLGILDPDERRTFEAHLNECPECSAEVRSMMAAVDALARSVPQRTPPADLRERVMASIRRAASPQVRPNPATNPWGDRRVWLPVASLLLIALGAGIYGSHLHVETRLAALAERAEATDRDIAAARPASADARSAMEVIAAPDVIRIDLKGQGAAANATARALWSRAHGMVFAGTNIPQPPPGMCHQVWVVTARTTVSAGILPELGVGLAVFDTPPDMPQPASVAVTLEPAGGSVVPTGAKILVGNTADSGR
jgi:anti-sigma-K factor RskA